MSQINQNHDKKISAYVINLIASVINGTQPREKDESISWESIVEFSKKQSVLNIVSYACERLKNKPDAQMMRYLREFRMQKIVVEAQQEIEFCDAMDKLESMGVRHMPLKGYIVKSLYPSPDMRTMGDLDLLIDEDRCEEVVEAFVSDGFTACASGDLHSNVERGNAYIEFHRALVNKKHKVLSEYFGKGFERAKLSDGFSYRYELTKEDMYIFLVAHVAKHYRYGGTGIRSILDLYVYRKVCTDLNLGYVYDEIEKIGLKTFYEKIEKIADEWFSGEFDSEFDTVSSYIVSGGVYGNEDDPLLNTFINETQGSIKSGKFKKWLITVFPGKELMTTRYPVLKKCLFLLPLFWVIRFFDTLIRTPQNFKKSVKDTTNILKIDDSLVDAQRDSGIGEL